MFDFHINETYGAAGRAAWLAITFGVQVIVLGGLLLGGAPLGHAVGMPGGAVKAIQWLIAALIVLASVWFVVATMRQGLSLFRNARGDDVESDRHDDDDDHDQHGMFRPGGVYRP